MCRRFSAIVSKDRVYFGESDGHSSICRQHGLPEETDVTRAKLVRYELVPKDTDAFAKKVLSKQALSLTDFQGNIDQTIIPAWASDDRNHDKLKRRVFAALTQSYLHYVEARFIRAETKLENAKYREYHQADALYAEYEASTEPAPFLAGQSLRSWLSDTRLEIMRDYTERLNLLRAKHQEKRKALTSQPFFF